MSGDMSIYFSGSRLYGDDFSLDQIRDWYRDEMEGYADLGSKDRRTYQYAYHELNKRHGFSNIRNRRFNRALGLGSAYGHEFMPIIKQVKHITIVDPSDTFSSTEEIDGVRCEYHKPNIDGRLSFDIGSFDLITCLGVMHHIPNVSAVMRECYRCLSADGIMLIREPIVSMGDWTKPRLGLTKRERGIPVNIFKDIICGSGFNIQSKTLCIFPALPKLANIFGIAVYNNYALTFLDEFLSRIFSRNIKYHRTDILSKIGPQSAYYVLDKGIGVHQDSS